MSSTADTTVWVAASWNAEVSVRNGDKMVAVISTGRERATVGKGVFSSISVGEVNSMVGVVVSMGLVVMVVDVKGGEEEERGKVLKQMKGEIVLQVGAWRTGDEK